MSDETVERYCEVMHDAYEAAALGAGWETQERSRKPWADVPEANKRTMRAAVRALLAAVAEDDNASSETASQLERQANAPTDGTCTGEHYPGYVCEAATLSDDPSETASDLESQTNAPSQEHSRLYCTCPRPVMGRHSTICPQYKPSEPCGVCGRRHPGPGTPGVCDR